MHGGEALSVVLWWWSIGGGFVIVELHYDCLLVPQYAVPMDPEEVNVLATRRAL